MKERQGSYSDFQREVFDEIEEKQGQIREGMLQKLVKLGKECGLDVHGMLKAGMVPREIVRVVKARIEEAGRKDG
jgi:hypothetical protein